MTCIDGCGSLGAYAKMLVEDSILTGDCPPATFDSESYRQEFLTENIQYTDTVLGGSGLTGTVDPIYAHLRPGTRMVFGRLVMEAGPNELAFWLPKILGNPASGTTYTTNETFDAAPVDIMMNRDQGTVIYRHMVPNRALLSARASIGGAEQVVQLAIDFIGYEEHDAVWPDPAPSLPETEHLFWLLGDAKLELDTNNPGPADEYYFDAFNFMVDNNLLPQTRNFLRITCLQSRGRKFRLQASIPYTSDSHSLLYINNLPKETGQGVLNFLGTKNLTGEDGENYVSTFTFPKLFQTRRTPSVRGPGDIPLLVDFMAYRTPSNEPLTAIIDATL